MKKYPSLLLLFIIISIAPPGQKLNPFVSKDSLLKVALSNVPMEQRADIHKMYDTGNDAARELFLVMFTMPRSSKEALIKNIEGNKEKIDYLKTEYAKLVPPNYTVDIEFEPANNVWSTPETIDISVEEIDKKTDEPYIREWNLNYDSKELNRLLNILGWNNGTLAKIKALLTDAHCISISNAKRTAIGFARSGMGEYSYLIFDHDLTKEEIKENNNGCTSIFYKKNIVLEYAGGAIGPECFPD